NVSLSPLAPPRGQLVQWNGVVGEQYYVRTSTTLFPPVWTVVGTNIATTTCPTFEVPPGVFVQVLQVAPPAVLPHLEIELLPGNLVRISWPTSAFGFTLQYSTSITGPWNPLQLPVSIEGNDFVVYDALGGGRRFYRLIK